MQLDLTFRYDDRGWLIGGLPRDPGCRFADFAEALDYAKRECTAEPPKIEVFVDGRYIVTAAQERGWLRQLCRPALAGVVMPARAGGPRRSRIAQLAGRLWRRVSRKGLHRAVQPAWRGSGGRLLFRR